MNKIGFKTMCDYIRFMIQDAKTFDICHVYVAQAKENKNLLKIGQTTGERDNKQIQLYKTRQRQGSVKIIKWIAVPSLYLGVVEYAFHNYFEHYRQDGEWFLVPEDHLKIVLDLFDKFDFNRDVKEKLI